MREIALRRINTKIAIVVKIIICIFIIATIFRLLFSYGIDPYLNYNDYSVRNDNTGGESFDLSAYTAVEQEFTASGNILNNVSLYYGNAPDRDVTVSVLSLNGESVAATDLNTASLSKEGWNEIGLCTDELEKGTSYKISIESEEGLEGFAIGNGAAPEDYAALTSDGAIIDGKLLLGLNQTYSYLNLANAFEFALRCLFTLFTAIALCVSVIRFEKIYGAFVKGKRRGFSYALFFAGSLVLMYNPIDSSKTEVLDFSRVIGEGLNANVDVSRRIDNFNHWFIAFGIVFVLFYMLANYCLRKLKTKNQKKTAAFLNDFMVLANCKLILRCITYFKDWTSERPAFYYSQGVVLLISITVICYLVLSLDQFVNPETFEQLIVISFCLSAALAVFWGKELGSGRVVLGINVIAVFVVLVLCRFAGKLTSKQSVARIIRLTAIAVSFIPLCTSLYIEMIHVLNQHNVFVAHPAKYYKVACILGFIAFVAVLIIAEIKKIDIKKWKNIVFPSLVAGITCLCMQIPISSTYEPDLVEGANISVLVGDFLNYGDIPIVQHYSGHMMKYVWEGILYAIINGDFSGIVSPYSGLLYVVTAVLFYYLIAKVWNREMAIAATLLLPIMVHFFYYGYGILVCLAAMAYVRENSTGNAMVLWGTLVWCALHRLDMGFAFGLASIIALLIYVIINRNITACKQLGKTLIIWGAAGGLAWLILCLVKGINPVNRLIEFLMISMSNQNWAYEEIGSTDNMVFAWVYIIVPFVMVLTLLYTVLSKEFREKTGTEKWILLLILNLSYFQNFSRGLVRHSLYENNPAVVLFCAYLVLAMFLAFYKQNMRWFIPTFMLLIAVNGLFLNPASFASWPLAEHAVSSPEPIIESWKPGLFNGEGGFKTEWEKIKHDREKVERIVLADDLINYASGYELVLDKLLDEGETFADFMNKTLLYPVLGYNCPVYVSQSPLQLSGDFTQKEFIKEIKDVPIVLMPVDRGNYFCSTSLDGIANAYRYYRVAEYIFKNYRPLCRYGNDYAVWCIPEKYDLYKSKLAEYADRKEYVQDLVSSESVERINVQLEEGEDDSVTAARTEGEPKLSELQNLIDTSAFIGQKLQVTIQYQTDSAAALKMFYTTEKEEEYTEEKVAKDLINGKGEAAFIIPITEYTRLRLDLSNKNNVVIKSIKAGYPVEYIDYGYDGPIENTSADGNKSYSYIGLLHNIRIQKLPEIWAEADGKRSGSNQEICSLNYSDGVYTFDSSALQQSSNGNYLKISASYDGMDENGKYKVDDEEIEAQVVFGQSINGEFIEKYRYNIVFDEGKHDYLIRCSTDYYWYLKEVNAVKIDTQGNLRNVSMSILEGD